jgi:hypothetical protein
VQEQLRLKALELGETKDAALAAGKRAEATSASMTTEMNTRITQLMSLRLSLLACWFSG